MRGRYGGFYNKQFFLDKHLTWKVTAGKEAYDEKTFRSLSQISFPNSLFLKIF